MALAPFRRERAVKKILLVKALPLRVVLLYRTAGWNARLFRKSLCKRLCKSLKTLSSAGGRPFRRSSGAAGGGEVYALGGRGEWPPSAAGGVGAHRQGQAVPTARGIAGVSRRRQKGARAPYGSLSPLAPAAGRRQCPACPSAANLACGGKPPERRNRSPSAEGKSHGASSRLHRLRRCIGGGSPLC